MPITNSNPSPTFSTDKVYFIDPGTKDAIDILTGAVCNYSYQDPQSPRYGARATAGKNGWWILATTFKKGNSAGKLTHRFIKEKIVLDEIVKGRYKSSLDLPRSVRKKFSNCIPSPSGHLEITKRAVKANPYGTPITFKSKTSGPATYFSPADVKPDPKPIDVKPAPEPVVEKEKSWGPRDFAKENTFPKKSIKELLVPNNLPKDVPDENSSEEDFIKFITNSYKYKAPFFKMSELKWKILVLSVLRGQNTILTGDKGEGKTMAAFAVAKSLKRRIEVFNFGNMQDAQTALIGKTFFDTSKGTFFSKSPFVDAITTPNTIILLDEFSRSSDDGYNIMFPVLDSNQRCLRLTDEVNSPKVKVAPGVCFIATANIGRGYSATRHIDDAIMDRFTTKLEVDRLTVAERVSVIKTVYPVLSDAVSELISNIVHKINDFAYGNAGSDARDLPKPISTRAVVELANLIYNGIDFEDAIESVIIPEYSSEGGLESDRTFVRQTIQGFIDSDKKSKMKVYESQVYS